MPEAELQSYVLRGNRVAKMTAGQVTESAHLFCKLFGVGKRTRYDAAQFLESLSKELICLDPIDDLDWLHVTAGVCTPDNFTILVPNSTYERACQGDQTAISTICHEIGHLVLAHKAVLHDEKSAKACREEDAEWQADLFADCVLRKMGFTPGQVQLSLDFGGLK